MQPEIKPLLKPSYMPVSIPQAVSTVATSEKESLALANLLHVSIPQAVSTVATMDILNLCPHDAKFQYRKR